MENEEIKNMFQTKKLDKFPETDLNEKEINDLLNREFKLTVIKMVTEIRRTMHEQRISTKKLKILKSAKQITELNNTITTENFNRGVQQQTKSSGRKDQQTGRQGSRIHPIRGARRKNERVKAL